MTWAAFGKGLRVGLNVAAKLVTLGLIHGKPEQAIVIAGKIDQAIEDEVAAAKAK